MHVTDDGLPKRVGARHRKRLKPNVVELQALILGNLNVSHTYGQLAPDRLPDK